MLPVDWKHLTQGGDIARSAIYMTSCHQADSVKPVGQLRGNSVSIRVYEEGIQ